MSPLKQFSFSTIAILIAISLSERAFAQKIGDLVNVVQDTELRVDDRTISTARIG